MEELEKSFWVELDAAIAEAQYPPLYPPQLNDLLESLGVLVVGSQEDDVSPYYLE